jgi:hypothetical protein
MPNGESSTALAPITGRTVSLRNLAEVERFGELIHNTSLVPKEYRGKLGDVVGIIFFGLEIGLNPLQALQGVMFVNGRPAVWGDTALAMVRASGLLEQFDETPPDEAQDTGIGRCLVQRRGEAPIERKFSKAMAEKAKLWGKDIWLAYPGRMLQQRARSWALRDAFSDVLKGLYTVEEARDIVLTPDATGTYTTPTPTPEPTSAPSESIAEAMLDDAREGLTREAQEARDFLLSQISETVTTAFPGNTVEAKRGRTGLLLEAFHVTARSQLLGLPLDTLRAGYATLQTLVPGSGGAEARGSGGSEALTVALDADDRPLGEAPVPTGPVMQQWYQLSKRAMAAGLSAAQYDALRAQDDYAAAVEAVAQAEGRGSGGEAVDG